MPPKKSFRSVEHTRPEADGAPIPSSPTLTPCVPLSLTKGGGRKTISGDTPDPGIPMSRDCTPEDANRAKLFPNQLSTVLEGGDISTLGVWSFNL